jgi:hypothetical protein
MACIGSFAKEIAVCGASRIGRLHDDENFDF